MNYKNFSCAGLFILDHEAKRILLGKDKNGFLSPQKGGYEPKIDHALFKCAIRETFEESGISIHELQFFEKEYIEHSPSGKPNILYWLAKLKEPKNDFKFDPFELESVDWYSFDNIKGLKHQRLEILKEMIIDLENVNWVDDISQKRFLFCNPEKKIDKPKNIHNKESRALVKLLRHDLDSQKIIYDSAGYVKLPNIIKCMKNLNLTVIQSIVEYDERYDKQRMDLKFEDDVWQIRANQGHSLKYLDEEKLLTEVFEAFPFCIHGTETKFLPSIQKSGLCKMGRTHVHCISSINFKDVISGFKKQSNCVIFIDMKASLAAGNRWFVSKNEVLLTEGPILPQFFLEIKNL